MTFLLNLILTASLVSARGIIQGRDASGSASSNGLSKPASSSSTAITSSSITSSSTSTASSSISSQNGLGGFIASGIGSGPESSSAQGLRTDSSSISKASNGVSQGTVSPSRIRSTIVIFKTITRSQVSSIRATGTRVSSSIPGTFIRSASGGLITTGVSGKLLPTSALGNGSLASCQTAIWQWYFSSSAAALSSGLYTVTNTTGSTWTSTIHPRVSRITVVDGVTSLTTLCDGHPRQIGTAAYSSESTTVLTDTISTTILSSVPAFATPPCSIAPSDCSSLWASYNNINKTKTSLSAIYPPPCPSGNATKVSFESELAMATGYRFISAVEAQLFYWPVQLENPAALHSNDSLNEFCHGLDRAPFAPGPEPNWTTPAVLPGTRTAAGPNIAVVSGITFTSPNVAVGFKRLQDMSGGGPTIDTVITMAPNQVSTNRGARILVRSEPIQYEHFNWVCQDKSKPNGTYTTRDTEGENCYQDVPAIAYFSAPARYDYFTVLQYQTANATIQSIVSHLTMQNDYRPQILVDDQAIGSALTKVWGPGAQFFFGGVWDPPSALSSDNGIIVPTVAPAGQTTTPQAQSAVITSPAAQQTPSAPSPTNTPIVPPLTTTTPVKPATQQQNTNLPPPPSPTVADPASSPSAGNQQNNNTPNNQQNTSPNNQQNTPPNNQQNTPPSNQQNTPPSNQQNTPPSTQQNTPPAGNQQNTQPSAGQQNTAPPAGQQNNDPNTVVAQPAAAPQTQVISIGNSAVTAVASGSNVIVGGTTLQAGAATTVAGQQVSNPSGGAVVVGGGDSATTVNLQPSPQPVAAQPQPTVISVGNTPVTAVNSGSAIVVGGATLTPGAATTIAGQQVSVASQGGAVVVGTGSTASTVVVSPAAAPLSISSISSNVVAVNGQTLTAGGSAATINGQQVSLGANGVVVSSGNAPVTIPANNVPASVTIGNSVVPLTSLASGVAVVGTQTLSVGGQPGSLNGLQLSIASNGLVIGTGSTAQTIPLSTASNNLITVGSQTFTRSVASNGVEVLSNGQTTLTLTPGSSAVTLGGQLVSAAPSGLVISSAAAATTIGLDTIKVGTDTFSVSKLSNGAEVVAGAKTTFTISPGGSAVTLNGETISAISSGVVVAGNGTTSTKLPGVTSTTAGSSPANKATGAAASSSAPPGSSSSRSVELGGSIFVTMLLGMIVALV